MRSISNIPIHIFEGQQLLEVGGNKIKQHDVKES